MHEVQQSRHVSCRSTVQHKTAKHMSGMTTQVVSPHSTATLAAPKTGEDGLAVAQTSNNASSSSAVQMTSKTYCRNHPAIHDLSLFKWVVSRSKTSCVGSCSADQNNRRLSHKSLELLCRLLDSRTRLAIGAGAGSNYQSIWLWSSLHDSAEQSRRSSHPQHHYRTEFVCPFSPAPDRICFPGARDIHQKGFWVPDLSSFAVVLFWPAPIQQHLISLRHRPRGEGRTTRDTVPHACRERNRLAT